MIELIRTNDIVLISWLTARLESLDIGTVVFDGHASVMDGSISAIPRRIMVLEEDLVQAQELLVEAEKIRSEEGYGFD